MHNCGIHDNKFKKTSGRGCILLYIFSNNEFFWSIKDQKIGGNIGKTFPKVKGDLFKCPEIY